VPPLACASKLDRSKRPSIRERAPTSLLPLPLLFFLSNTPRDKREKQRGSTTSRGKSYHARAARAQNARSFGRSRFHARSKREALPVEAGSRPNNARALPPPPPILLLSPGSYLSCKSGPWGGGCARGDFIQGTT